MTSAIAFYWHMEGELKKKVALWLCFTWTVWCSGYRILDNFIYHKIDKKNCLLGPAVSVCDCRSRGFEFDSRDEPKILLRFCYKIFLKPALEYRNISRPKVPVAKNNHGNRSWKVSILKYIDNDFNLEGFHIKFEEVRCKLLRGKNWYLGKTCKIDPK